jgi:predicted CopG family antitoxin
MKTGSESFSDVVLRLAEKNKKKFNIDDFAGKWADYDEWDKIKKELELSRKNFKTSKVNF